MNFRIGIQIISFNRPDYLEKTLLSLYKVISEDDKVCVIEQSSEQNKEKCLSVCRKFKNIFIIDSPVNLGQRGATNKVYESGFFNDTKYVMLSDHDNIFHVSLDKYCEILDKYNDVWVATGYNSPEHDIENKDGEIIFKSSARAGHMVMRTIDFMTLCPIDLEFGTTKPNYNCAWFCGLDWWITHWAPCKRPKDREFIACYSGGVEHIGRESTWQGKYDEEYDYETLIWMRNANLYNIIRRFPPKHRYISGKYWYEEMSDSELRKKLNVTIDDKEIEILNKVSKCISKELSISELDKIKKFFNIENNLINIKSIDFAVVTTHYYSKKRESLTYKYTRRKYSLELWRRRIRHFYGNEIPLIVFDDNSENFDEIISYIEEPVKVINLDKIEELTPPDHGFIIYRFNTHLGRTDDFFPGWDRSFKTLLRLNVETIIFNELDLLTNITLDDYNGIYLTGLWNDRFIETSIQILSKSIRLKILENYRYDEEFKQIPEITLINILRDDLDKFDIIPGLRIDERNIFNIYWDKYWIANPSNFVYENFYNDNNISLKFDIKPKKTIVAFNYLWPEYGISFLEKSIKSILPYVSEYHLFLNKYSYFGNECDIYNLNEVLNICERCSKLGKIIIHHNDEKITVDKKFSNIIYYYEKIISIIKDYADYVWLIQSDEIYDEFSILSVIDLCNNDQIECSAVTFPHVYYDTPHWKITPIEPYFRPTIVNLKNPNFSNRIETNIDFYHLSYVLSRKDLKIKFNNWGHKKDLDKNPDYYYIFEFIKTHKDMLDFHPINPSEYHSIEFINTKTCRENFLQYIKYLLKYENKNISFIELLRKFIENVIYELIPIHGTVFNIIDKLNIGDTQLDEYQYFHGINYKESVKINLIEDYSSYLYLLKHIFDKSLFSENNMLLLGNIKTLIPIQKNDFFDCIYIHYTEDSDKLKNSIIEVWPKLKNYGIMFGIYKSNQFEIINYCFNYKNIIECPWGKERFYVYEKYLDILGDIGIDSEYKIWLIRCRKK